MDRLQKVGTDIRDGWNNLEPKKRTRLIILVVIAIAVLTGLAYFTQKNNYTVLFSNLNESEAGAIVEDLETQGMDYELQDNGATILIDEEEIDRYRINLAMNGMMPNSSSGFEIFDDAGMMTTDDDRAMMYQRAVQAELENSMRSLEQVDDAQVILNLPEESIFQNPEYQSQSSASVRLNTSGTLDQQAVQGIASLVSGAVANLPIENINIVDAQGTLLSGFLQNGENGQIDYSSNNQSIRRAFEEDMEQRIINLLGPETRVSVYADMDFEAVEGERVRYYNPIDEEIIDDEVEQERRGLLRSETVSGRGYDDYSGLIDIENQPETDDDDAVDGENRSIDTTRNYELNQDTERFVRAPGVVQDLTATVIVDEALGMNAQEIRELTARAIGLNVDTNELGDYIFVDSRQADGFEEEGTPIGGSFTDQMLEMLQNIWPYLVGSIALIVIVWLILMILRKRNDEDELDEFDDELALDAVNAPTQPITPIVPEVDLEEEQRKANKEQKNKVLDEREEKAKQTASENPELAAELMKLWMTDKQNRNS